MRKREFLNQLRRRLNEEKCNDVDDIVSYYDELIEDTIERTGEYEETVVKELGSIEDIVIRVNPSAKAKNRNTERIYYDEYESNDNSKKEIRNTKPVKTKAKKDDDVAIKIIIAIVTAPLWIGAIIVLAAVIFSAAVAGIAVGITGVVSIIQGIIAISSGLGNALFQMGVGCILCGLATLGAPLIIKIITVLIKAIIAFVKWLFGALNNSGRRMAYEN